MITVIDTLFSPPSRNIRRLSPPLPLRSIWIAPSIKCALTKHGHRFLSSLEDAAGDSSAITRLIHRFVSSSPKSVALNALSHLLSPNTTHPHLVSQVIPLYRRITGAFWFSYNQKLAADIIALLYQLEKFDEAEALISEAVAKLGLRKGRDLCLFYCSLIDSQSKQRSDRGVSQSYNLLKQLASDSSSVTVKRRAYEAMVNGLCTIGLPQEAEQVMKDMSFSGLKPSVIQFRCVVHGYGRLGKLEEMKEVINHMRNEGFEMDTICSNTVLSSYGSHGNHSQILHCLQKMESSSLSIRSYNSVLSSNQTMRSMLEGGNQNPFPMSTEKLLGILNREEALVVQELIASPVLHTVMEWKLSEMKLDLHGSHLCSAYLILLQWVEEMRRRFRDGTWVVPAEVRVVCGAGKHSIIRGKSPVKDLVKEMMARANSPFRIDRKNTGCFVAKGKAVQLWLH